MGCAASKRCGELREEARALRAKIHALEGEVWAARRERGRREADFAAKQVEWRRERRRHREEVAALQKRLGADQEEACSRRAMEEDEEYYYYSAAAAAAAAAATATAGDDGGAPERAAALQRASAWGLVEQMKAEQAQREQAVEKWKQLYLAIKSELDALILTTKQGERLCSWMTEESVMEQLHIELKAKEEMIQALKSHLEAKEADGAKREREVDILRQSLRILGGKKKRNRGRKNLVRSWRWRAERRGLQPAAQVTCASSFRL